MKKILAICAMICASVININAYTIPSYEDVGVYGYVNRLWDNQCLVHVYISIDYSKYVVESVKLIDTDNVYTQPLYPNWEHNEKYQREYWTMHSYIPLPGYTPWGEIVGTRDFYVLVILRDKNCNHYVYYNDQFKGYYSSSPRQSNKGKITLQKILK